MAMMMTTAMGNARTRLFAIADISGGSRALDVARCIAGCVAGWGVSVLLVDGTRADAGFPARSTHEIRPHVPSLERDALRACLRVGRNRSFGALRCDGPFPEAEDEALLSAYDLALMAMPRLCETDVPQMARGLPALLLAVAPEGDAWEGATRHVGEWMRWRGGPRPVAWAAAASAAAAVAESLSMRWSLPYWGALEEVEHLSERILEHASALPPGGAAPEVPACAGTCMDAGRTDGADGDEGMPPSVPDVSDDVRDIAGRILQRLRDERGFQKLTLVAPGDEADAQARAQIERAAERLARDIAGGPLAASVESAVVAMVVAEAMGCGPLEPLLADADVAEIMVNGPAQVFVERAGRIAAAPCRFTDRSHILAVIERMVARAGRRVDESSPMVDCRLPDGSRLNVVLPPLALDGPVATIRKFSRRARTVDDALRTGMISRAVAPFLLACVRARVSMAISGGTGAGKTTLLGILAGACDPSERIITIEDAAELALDARHVVRLEARPPGVEGAGAVSIRDLVRNALRMRPDRIVVGECRGPEALDMLQAMNTGHEGSLTTVHANSPRDAIARLETMVLMAGTELPLLAVREQIMRAIRVIVQVARGANGVRRVSEIAELVGLEGGTPCLQTIAAPDADGILAWTGVASRIAEHLAAAGVHVSM